MSPPPPLTIWGGSSDPPPPPQMNFSPAKWSESYIHPWPGIRAPLNPRSSAAICTCAGALLKYAAPTDTHRVPWEMLYPRPEAGAPPPPCRVPSCTGGRVLNMISAAQDEAIHEGLNVRVGSGWSLTGEKKSVPERVFPKQPAGTPCAQPWLVAVGGWRRLAAVGGWRSATGGWWRLVVVGGGWWLVVGGWWRLAVGGWSPLAVGSGWWLAVGGGWWLAVGGVWRLMGVGDWRLVVPWGGP